MADLVLHDNPASSNALKVRFLLAVLDLPYTRVHVPFARPRPAGLTAWHPFGTIPALVDGDLRLAESHAILRYLAGREGRDDLYPAHPARRGAVDWALDTWATGVRPPLQALERATIWVGDPEGGRGRPEDADGAAVEAARPAAERALDTWEAWLSEHGGGDTVVPGGLTIADCAVAPVLWRTLRLPLDLAGRPHTARLREALAAHPAFVAAGPVA